MCKAEAEAARQAVEAEAAESAQVRARRTDEAEWLKTLAADRCSASQAPAWQNKVPLLLKENDLAVLTELLKHHKGCRETGAALEMDLITEELLALQQRNRELEAGNFDLSEDNTHLVETQMNLRLTHERLELALRMSVLARKRLRVFMAWAEQATDCRRRRQILVTVIITRRMAQAFAGWAAKVSDVRRRRQILTRARGRWVHGALSAAFQGCPPQSVGTFGLEANSYVAEGRSVSREDDGHLVRMHTKLQVTLESLDMAVEESARARKQLRVFIAWAEQVPGSHRRRQILEKADTKRLMARVFAGWKRSMADARRQMRVLVGLRGRWVHRALSTAFQGLRSLLTERARSRTLLERAAQRILHQRLGTAVNHWRWHWQRAQQARRQLAKTVARWSQICMCQAFAWWSKKAVYSKWLQRILTWLRRRRLHERLCCAFQAWLSLIADFTCIRQLFDRTAQKILYRRLNAAVNQWWLYWQQAQQVHRLLTQLANRCAAAHLISHAWAYV